jgi:hypothetical protein
LRRIWAPIGRLKNGFLFSVRKIFGGTGVSPVRNRLESLFHR